MLSDIERQLLCHYSERERTIRGQRTAQHQRLLALGYIREQLHPNTSDRRIIVTPAGHAVLEDGPNVA